MATGDISLSRTKTSGNRRFQTDGDDLSLVVKIKVQIKLYNCRVEAGKKNKYTIFYSLLSTFYFFAFI
jgi:hypothetical protein